MFKVLCFWVQVFKGLGSFKARDFEGFYSGCLGLGFFSGFRVWVF